MIAWLVESHLLMSTVSQKQDLSDPDVIHDFAIAMGSRARLDYLYVLTVADINGTNPELWNVAFVFIATTLWWGSRALRRGLENP